MRSVGRGGQRSAVDLEPTGVWFCHPAGMSMDPVVTNSEHYRVLFENDRVRVLEYTDQPGDVTTPHQHPDSVMYTMSSVRRRLVSGDVGREVELAAGAANWLPAQIHHGENIGDTTTHVIFVELKGAGAELGGPAEAGPGELGPRSS
jgi:quercetin dioxygenase-like cupin family protein